MWLWHKRLGNPTGTETKKYLMNGMEHVVHEHIVISITPTMFVNTDQCDMCDIL